MLTKAAELAAEELETLETPTVRVMAPVLALALEAAAAGAAERYVLVLLASALRYARRLMLSEVAMRVE